jgi:hypothetical protein
MNEVEDDDEHEGRDNLKLRIGLSGWVTNVI